MSQLLSDSVPPISTKSFLLHSHTMSHSEKECTCDPLYTATYHPSTTLMITRLAYLHITESMPSVKTD